MDKIFCDLDSPKEDDEFENILVLKGWAFSVGEEVTIKIFIDGKFVDYAPWGMPRFDVEKKYPDDNNSYLSGFIARIPTRKLDYDRHILTVRGQTKKDEVVMRSININKVLNVTKIPVNSIPIGRRGKFLEKGKKILDIFKTLGKLEPDQRVLEIGCGMGRLALPMTKYLQKGEYYGLDIIPICIEYCKDNIEEKYLNSHFRLLDVYNKEYNRLSKFRGSDIRLPFESDYFDFVCLQSVFTHMLPDDVRNYLKEINRVLKKGGRCLITYFILKDPAQTVFKSKKLDFQFKFEKYWSTNEKVPEKAIAFDEQDVRRMYSDADLIIEEPIHYGRWNSDGTGIESQDVIIGLKN